MEVLKTALFGTPLLKVAADVGHLSAQALEKCVQESLRADAPPPATLEGNGNDG